MAEKNVSLVLKWVGLSEGGYVNHPRDPGGATNKGIIQRTYDSYRKLNKLPKKDVRYITDKEVEDILVTQYLTPVKFNELPSGLDYAVADYSVNSGASRAIKDLQRTLRARGHVVSVDGVLGLQTMAAIRQEKNIQSLIVEYCITRMKFLRSLSIYKTFGVGWTRRVMGEEDGVQDRDTGVIDRAYKMAAGIETVTPPKPAPGKALEANQVIIVALVIAAIAFIFNKVKSFFERKNDDK